MTGSYCNIYDGLDLYSFVAQGFGYALIYCTNKTSTPKTSPLVAKASSAVTNWILF